MRERAVCVYSKFESEWIATFKTHKTPKVYFYTICFFYYVSALTHLFVFSPPITLGAHKTAVIQSTAVRWHSLSRDIRGPTATAVSCLRACVRIFSFAFFVGVFSALLPFFMLAIVMCLSVSPSMIISMSSYAFNLIAFLLITNSNTHSQWMLLCHSTAWNKSFCVLCENK